MATDVKNPFLKAKSQDVEDINLDNLDDLLLQLSHAEIEELNGDFDPDNSLLPSSQRQRDQTDKSPTGPFNKQKLLAFLEKTAREEKDWDQPKQFESKVRGKKFVAKEMEEEKLKLGADEDGVETEWDDILKEASEEELVDLAAVLGFHSMLTQVQYHASLQEETISEGGFKAAAKAEALKIIPNEPPNSTDVDDSLDKIKNNDSKLINLNLNNLRNISIERLTEFCEALKTNTSLKVLHMANTNLTDKVAKVLAESLKENKTLRVLNIESNFVTGDCLLSIVKAINEQKTIVELRVANQKPSVLGNPVEMAISRLVAENETLLRFGVFFEFPDARIRVHEKLKANNDILRKERRLKAKK